MRCRQDREPHRRVDYQRAIDDIVRRTQCPTCRRSLHGCSIEIVAHDDTSVLAELVCTGCGGARMMFADIGPQTAELIGALSVQERDERRRGPITADELIDVHRALASLEGVSARALVR